MPYIASSGKDREKAAEKRRKAMKKGFKDLGKAISKKREKDAAAKAEKGVDTLAENKDRLKRITSRMGVA